MGLTRPRRVLVVANPAAGVSRRRDAGEAAARAVREAGCAVELLRTQGPGDARRLAGAAAPDTVDLVIAAGGDGTVNEVANGLAGRGVPLAVAPAGTMNLLARVLRLPLDPSAAVGRIIHGYHPAGIRPGDAGGRLFLLMAGAGFDAWVLRELVRGSAGKIGFGSYIRGAMRGLRTFPFPRLVIDHDGKTLTAHTAIVGRAPLYGGFLLPTPRARLHVDAFELCAIDGGAAHLASIVPRLFSGAHAGRAGVTLAGAQRVAIASPDSEVPYQLDGELVGTLPVAIALSERILVLATPGGLS